MLLNASIIIAVTVFCVFVFAHTVKIWMRALQRHSENLQGAQDALEQAYQAATALIQDPKTPDSVINFVGDSYRYVGKPNLIRLLALGITLRILLGLRFPKHRAVFDEDIKNLSASQKENLTNLVHHAAIASILSDFFFSGLYMRLRHLLASVSLTGSKDNRPSPDRINVIASFMNQYYVSHNQAAA